MKAIRLPNITTIKKEHLLFLLFITYFCSYVIIRVINGVFHTTDGIYIQTFAFYLFIVVYCFWDYGRNLTTAFFCYCIVAVLIMLTMVAHPEYSDWFADPTYGIVPRFLYGNSGIFGFAVILFVTDRTQLFHYLEVAVWIIFIYCSYMFLIFIRRGYWVISDEGGGLVRTLYHIDFGYQMLFAAAFFLGCAFLESKKKYYIPYVLAVIMIVMGGSRGATIIALLIIFTMVPFRWKSFSKTQRWTTVLLLILITPIVIVGVVNLEVLLSQFEFLLARFNISSRTIEMLLSGDITTGNGRNRIFEMAIDLIKDGGMFGHGVYGDRYVIGNYFKWGYCHNIFLEFFVSFGYIGGIAASLLVVILPIRCYMRIQEAKDEIIFITLLATSTKLLGSDSFWYLPAFWGLLAFMILFLKQDKRTRYLVNDD